MLRSHPSSQMNTLESIWVQYMKFVYERCNSSVLKRVFSNFHAGGGQQVLGSSHKQHCDLLLITKEDQKTTLNFFNFHGMYFHYNTHTSNCNQSTTNKPLSDYFQWDSDSLKQDHFRLNYVRAMSKVNENLVFRYNIHTECQFFHNSEYTSPLTNQVYRSLKTMLKHEDSNNCVFSNLKSSYTQKNLVQDILNDKLQGFVTIRGGTEKNDNDIESQFGFCVQKSKISVDDASNYTKNQIIHTFKNEPYDESNKQHLDFLTAYFKKQIERNHTRTYISEDHLETMKCSYLKFLISTRGFHKFEIVHYLHYSEKLWFKF